MTDKNNAVKITASRMDADSNDFASGLSNALTKDGQTTPTANIPLGGYRITNLGDASADTDALNRQAADARYLRQSTAVADLKALLDEAVHTTTDVASATTCDIGAAATDRVRITGTTTITGFGTSVDRLRFVHFSGALTLTHNATSLILPGGANITTAAGDTAIFSSDASGNWRCLVYQYASNIPVLAGIELGNVSDTTIARSSAGVVTIEGNTILTNGQTATLSKGFAATPYNAGTKSSGTYTPNESDGNLQYATNGGAHTLAPPTNNCTIIIQYTNNGSAGAITTSGFTVVTGSSLTTTNGDDFLVYITKNNGFSHMHVQALQ